MIPSLEAREKFTSKSRGMTLVEVMIATAVASGLILAISQMMNHMTQSARSITLSGDWTELVNNVRLTLSQTANCDTYLGGKLVRDTPGNATVINGDLTIAGHTYLSAARVLNGFGPPTAPEVMVKLRTATDDRVTDVRLFETPPGGPVIYKRHKVWLELIAMKVVASGPSGIAVGGSRVSAEGARSIALTVLTEDGAGDRPIRHCFTDKHAAAEACWALGGIYDTTPVANGWPLIYADDRYRCRLNDIYFASGSADQSMPDGGSAAGPHTEKAIRGQKIQLRSNAGLAGQGISNAFDSAIGIAPARLNANGVNIGPDVWFNAGPLQSEFLFYNDGTRRLASISNTGMLGLSNPSNMYGFPNEGAGLLANGTRLQLSSATPGSVSANDLSIGIGMEFGNQAMWFNSGASGKYVWFTAGGGARLMEAGEIGGFVGRALALPATTRALFAGRVGTNAAVDMVNGPITMTNANVSVNGGSLNVNTAAIFAGTAEFRQLSNFFGVTNIFSTGGNVAHACVWQNGSSCGGGRVLMSGTGTCGPAAYIYSSGYTAGSWVVQCAQYQPNPQYVFVDSGGNPNSQQVVSSVNVANTTFTGTTLQVLCCSQ